MTNNITLQVHAPGIYGKRISPGEWWEFVANGGTANRVQMFDCISIHKYNFTANLKALHSKRVLFQIIMIT